ncbi:TOMM precursor leader peptide-binding protein [Nocardiopsis sp. NPDC055879]
MMEPTTWLAGSGELYDTIVDRLVLDGGAVAVDSLAEAVVAEGDTVVLARDGWEPQRDAEEQARVRGVARLLPLRLIGDLGVVGPWVVPGRPGCQVCAERRRHLWRRQNFREEPLEAPVPGLAFTRAHLDHFSLLAEQALSGRLLGEREIHVVRGDLTSHTHTMVPLPNCPGCSVLPVDSAELAAMALQPRPQSDPEAFRAETAGRPPELLRAQIHDWRYGPVGHIFRSENSVMALSSAELALPSGHPGEGGHGRAATYGRGETIALYEAMERLASATPHGKRTVVRGAENELDEAVDLKELGLHDPRCYSDPLFAFHPYDPDVPTDWVWGWKLGEGKPVLVPEHVAYWNIDGWGRTGHAPRFLYESSNGCALGASPEEAALYGLFEVVERDAFLLTWYTKRPAHPLRVSDEEVPELRGMRALLDTFGYDLSLFDITTEIGIPAVLSLVVRRDDEGPVAFFAAGAHCDPRRAVSSAAMEAVTNAVIRERLPEKMRHEQEEKARPLLDDPTRAQTLHDHTVLYNFPETRPWWSFLDPDRPARTLWEQFGDWRARWVRDDLTDVLRTAVSALTANGLDAIVVDQTDHCLTDPKPATVKVLVPQAVPMTFGHAHRRTRHLRRLTQLPSRLGYRRADEPAVDPDLVPPHPFP